MSTSQSYTAVITVTTEVGIVADSLVDAIKVAIDHVDTPLPNATSIKKIVLALDQPCDEP